jgi:cytochrome c peroxidase
VVALVKRGTIALLSLAALSLAIVVGATREERPRFVSQRASKPTSFPPLPAARSTRAGIELGRRLFFDSRLSASDTISCATCHDPERAFTDGEARSTRGARGTPLPRNTPGLANIAWTPALFWDGGSRNLESLVLGPITHPDEMAETVERMIQQLGADVELAAAFARAFPGEGVTPSTVMKALAQYMRSLISSDSKYDRHVRRGEPLEPAEHRGHAIYQRHCARCHATDLFTDQGYRDIGLDPAAALDAEDPRRGRARVTFESSDERAFRTPTLRNLGFTAPYMHDGRFATLEAVLDHYARGIHRTPALDPGLANGIQLSPDERADLIAFLGTLDDHAFVERHVRARTDPPASDP